MPTVLLPDAELVAVNWARTNPAIAAIVGGRVATRLPETSRLTFPFLRVFRVATGTAERSEAPTDVALLQWDAFADGSLEGGQDYGTASLLARTVAAELTVFDGYQGDPVDRRVTLGDGSEAIIDGSQVSSGPDRQTEPTTGWARYRLDTLVQIRPG
jgi:hypothetical protein